MIYFHGKEYNEVVNATCCVLSIASIKNNSLDDVYSTECYHQIEELKSGLVDFNNVVRLLVPHAKYEMGLGFKEYAEQIMHLIFMLQFHRDSPMSKDARQSEKTDYIFSK